jgi:RNA polymerase sigma factor (sigma-70 family)
MAENLQTEIDAESRLGQSVHAMTATSDALLVTWAQNGEQLAYVELCRRHREMVFRTVLRITQNTHDAEDVLQDSWMKAFTHIGTFDQRSTFSTWVTRIAINSALTTIRRRGKLREFSLDDPIDPCSRRVAEMLELSRNPEERCLETEQMRLLRQAIERLPPTLRTAIEIRQSHDGPVNELAMLVGVSLPTMKSRLLRARLRLREPLSQVLKGRSAPDASQQTNEEDSVRRTSRRKNRSKEIAVARDHRSTNESSLPLNEAGVKRNHSEDGHWVIDQQLPVDCSELLEF